MRTLTFAADLWDGTISGRKRITLRKYRAGAHGFSAGEVITGAFTDGRTLVLRVTADTEVKTFAELSDAEAREDGFLDAADALRGMVAYYPDLTERTPLAIIRFELA